MQLPGLSRDPTPESARDEIRLLATEYHALVEDDSARLRRYKDYNDEFDAPRSVDIFGQVADVTDYGHRRNVSTPARHNIPIPLGTALTIKHSHRLFGQLPDTIVDRRQESPFERYRSDTIEKIVWAIIRASGGKTLFKDGAWDGSKLGASCFELYYDLDQQLPLACTVDPGEIVVVKGARKPHDFHRIYRSWEVTLGQLLSDYRGKDYRGVPVEELLAHISTTRVTLVQMTDRQRTVRFVLDGGGEGAKRIPIYERDHGLNFVPYVVIPNIGPEREVFGWSDYELVRGLVHYIPTLFSREADILRAVAGGAYQEDGTGQSPAKIMDIVRKGGILPTKRGSTVKPIEAPSVPDFAPLHADRGMDLLKMVGFAPDAAWGDGSAGSGSDRGLQLGPLLELTAMKQSNWMSGLQRLFGMALRMLELKAGPGHSSYYTGQVQRGSRRLPFVLGPFGSDVEPFKANPQTLQPVAAPAMAPELQPASEDLDLVELPRSPKELFQGDYTVRFEWQNRIDPDDPAYVASELNKFQQGAQSLRTTLERLGINNPEDEMKLIEQEAERFPWLRQGMIALLEAELNSSQQGQGGGPPAGGDIGGAAGAMAGGDTSATDADALSRALPGRGVGTPYGAA